MPVVDRRPTPLSPQALSLYLRDAFVVLKGRAPSSNLLGCAWAQVALEHARGEAVFNYNLGNVMAGSKWPGAAYVLRVQEQTAPGVWEFFDARFRAHASPLDGALDYWRFLDGSRWAGAWAAMERGEPEAAAHELKAHGYYTADEARYARALAALFAEWGAELGPELCGGEGAACEGLPESVRAFAAGMVALGLDGALRRSFEG